MSNAAQTNLREPDQMNWDNYNPGGKYSPPPPAEGPDGKPIVYYGQVKAKFEDKDLSATDEGYRSYQVGPLTIVKSGTKADGHQIKFAYVNVKKREKNGKTIDASSAGDFLRAAQIVAKPQTNDQYDAAVRQTANKVVPFVIDWEARNKETGEEVKGFRSFPMDPDRPGERKAILKKGDVVNILDNQGNVVGQKTVTSEVLFANARVRYYRDPNRK
jgi:hypothetical protein